MNRFAFDRSLEASSPPAGLAVALAALWWESKGDWERAHHAAQQDASAAGAAVHAYLHRKEGDLANAAHWYRCAGGAPATGPLEQERERLLALLLDP
jgi:hypothetical protein